MVENKKKSKDSRLPRVNRNSSGQSAHIRRKHASHSGTTRSPFFTKHWRPVDEALITPSCVDRSRRHSVHHAVSTYQGDTLYTKLCRPIKETLCTPNCVDLSRRHSVHRAVSTYQGDTVYTELCRPVKETLCTPNCVDLSRRHSVHQAVSTYQGDTLYTKLWGLINEILLITNSEDSSTKPFSRQTLGPFFLIHTKTMKITVHWQLIHTNNSFNGYTIDWN